MVKEISKGLYNVGVYDNKIDLFEGHYKVPNGVLYNSYLLLGEKVIVIDSVDKNYIEEWLKNIKSVLNGKNVDYLIIGHMEPDHSAGIFEFLKQYPNAKIIGNMLTFAMLQQYFPDINLENKIVITDNQELTLGEKEFKFIFAQMVHWPEVFFTYEKTTRTLFSADAFGRFGPNDNSNWEDEARRYYIGIVGKYGMQVQNALKKVADLNVDKICSLHGPVLEKDLSKYINLYNTWSSYAPEKEGVTIAYTSVYGHTKQAVEILLKELQSNNIECKVFDLARCDMYEAVANAFKYSNLVLATTTYNMDIFPYMREFVECLTLRNFQNRNVAIIENGTWAPNAKNVINSLLKDSKNLRFSENCITIKSNLSKENIQTINNLALEIKEQLK